MTRSTDQLATLSALSAILDLANGLGHEKSLLTGLFALELAAEDGLDEAQQRAAFFAGLLRHLGCTAYAPSEAQLVPDDISLRKNLILGDSSNPVEVLGAVGRSHSTLLGRAMGLGRVVTSRQRLKAEWTHEACGAARLLAAGLGLGPDVLDALDQVFERWDGKGGPRGLGGSALSRVGQHASAAHLALAFSMSGGVELAVEVLELRSGKALEPKLARQAKALLRRFDGQTESRTERIEKLDRAAPLPVSLETIAVTFGDFADLQSPFTRGHSRHVATLALDAAAGLPLNDADRAALLLAAHLHDLGQVAVPTGVWLRPRWRDVERERARGHPFFTERVLAASPLAEAGKLAGAHHERLDGSGYHRATAAALQPVAARLLAATDMACGLVEARPHRPAHAPLAARGLVRDAVKSGHLDAACVDAIERAQGHAPAPRSGPRVELTDREHEVLVLLARGQTNKQIAASLGISDRTVQHHTIHIYEKLGVDTRAAAAVLAARYGWV